MPRVSVLIPATRAEYLPQALASVLAQTYGDFDVIVGDDTKDGRLAEVVDRFRDPRITYYWANSGSQQGNVTFLWEHSSAPLLKYLYDDDFLMPFCLAALVEAIEVDAQAVFSFCRLHVVDADGRLTDERAGRPSGKPVVLTGESVVGGCSARPTTSSASPQPA